MTKRTVFLVGYVTSAMLVAFTVWWTTSAFPLWLMVPWFFGKIPANE